MRICVLIWPQILLGLAFGLLGPSCLALEKSGMPDLAQVEQTCLPTSTANLLIWFGHHGYPKLLLTGATEDDRNLHIVHRLMIDTEARFDLGTRMDRVAHGIEHYIRDSGYPGNVEYRGIDGTGPAFSQEWLRENDSPDKGFILLLAYGRFDPSTHVFAPILNVGHAVTLVNASPDFLLVHDPAHEDDETGRKILTPFLIADGTWQSPSGSASIAGFPLVSGSLLEAPENCQVLLVGAVCITMHTVASSGALASSGLSPTLLAGSGSTLPIATSAPAAAPWWNRLLSLFF